MCPKTCPPYHSYRQPEILLQLLLEVDTLKKHTDKDTGAALTLTLDKIVLVVGRPTTNMHNTPSVVIYFASIQRWGIARVTIQNVFFCLPIR